MPCLTYEAARTSGKVAIDTNVKDKYGYQFYTIGHSDMISDSFEANW